MKKLVLFSTTAVIFLFSTVTGYTQSDGHSMKMKMDHGEVNFKTSCNMKAQAKFENGLAMLHHMMYEQAEDLFNEVIATDPHCAMGYWGIAMTQLHPLWAPPKDKEFEKGYDAIKKAGSVGSPSAQEKDYINALKAFYETAEKTSFREGLKAWNLALDDLYKKYPNDIDAGAFYGLSLLATASPDDNTYGNQRKAGAMLEKLMGKAPKHPGLFHYIIHSYDNPVLAEKAIKVAHEYDKLAPDVPHALHMPSHIFVRVGMWDETIHWNKRSAEAALRQPVAGMTSFHHTHALDYMMYAYLQQGHDKKAKAVLDEIMSINNYQPNFAAAYGIAAAQARYPLERRKWDEAAKIELRAHDKFPWDNFPQYEAITYWARGLGAAKSGEVESAQKAVEKLKELHEKTLKNDEKYWALLVDAQRITVEAWIAQAGGKSEQALELMRKAADMEDSVDKHPVTPSNVLPARELLGDMLLLNKKPEEAIKAYEAALKISPNRFNSLYGAGKAAEMAGKPELAKKYFKQLNEIAEIEGSDRMELKQVEGFLHKK
jgi:tetratricopeptide (TPR) repeat protein